MKILMFSVREDEKQFIQKWAQEHDAEVETNQEIVDAQTIELAKGFDGISVQQHEAINDPAVYEKLAQMGIHHIALRMTGFNVVNLEAAKENGIAITNVPAYSPRSVSEEALAYTMGLLRKIKEAGLKMKEHDFSWPGLQTTEIHNMTVGILGAGKIGGTSARIFRALGARVIANDLVQRPELADTLEYVSFDELLKQSDVITIHTILDDSTHHLIDADALHKMKNTALLINCARGPIVEPNALVAALQNGEIAGAGLDTVEGEEGVVENDLRDSDRDLSLFDTLLAMPNVTMTPHIGFYTDAAVSSMVSMSLYDVDSLLHDKPSDHIVGG